MNLSVKFLIFILAIFTQLANSQDVEELDDPDETQYFDQLLEKLFSTYSLETTDQMQSQLRQRIQYSSSLQGWRVVNKGRVWNNYGHLTILTEQDPGENRLTDHAVLSLSSGSVPGFDDLILGDFHVNWGGGLILNQQGSRMSLNPRSLMRWKQLSMRPHYSTREINYFRGVAGRFSFNSTQGSVFASRRQARGSWDDEVFKEDADGIHPSGKFYEVHHVDALGIALQTQASMFRIYSALLYHPVESRQLQYEIGLSKSSTGSHSYQLYFNSFDVDDQRFLVSWMYATKPVVFSMQYRRHLSLMDISSGDVSSNLGSAAINEAGLSFRAQIRPIKKIQVRYALETGHPAHPRSYEDYRTIYQHKLQVSRRNTKGLFQFDYSQKRESSLLGGSIWDNQLTQQDLTKMAVSMIRYYSSEIKYRVNLKSAFWGGNFGVLLQQRLSGDIGGWSWSLGYTRYIIPTFLMRLSIYETSVAESFGFYTAYDDGDRWFAYLKQQAHENIDLELKVTRTRSFHTNVGPEKIALSLQMSVKL